MNGKRRWAILVVLLGVGIVAWSSGRLVLDHLMQNPGAVPLPNEIAGLPLDNAYYAMRAVEDFSSLHGQNFALVGGAVGQYLDHSEVVIWVGEAPLAIMAFEMTLRMERVIGKGHSPFLPLGNYNQGNIRVYELEGLGQRHFYFRVGRLVIWLAADALVAEQALADTLFFYQ